MPITETAWSTWSITRSIVGRARSITNGRIMIPSTPPRAAIASICASLRLRGVSYSARQAACETSTGASPRGLEHVGEGLLGGVREVEDHAARREPLDEAAAAHAEPALRRLGDAVGEDVAVVPGQAGHAHAERPEVVGQLVVGLPRLGALDRQHEADPVVGGERLHVAGARDLPHVGRVLGERPVERGGLADRPAQRGLARRLDLGVDRADLQAHVARAQRRQPVAAERVLLVAAHDELHQQVVVCVGEQRGGGHPQRTVRPAMTGASGEV